MKSLALLALAVAVLAAVFCLQESEAQERPFSFDVKGCGGCLDGMLDYEDNETWTAYGTLPRTGFIWISPYPGDIGVRKLRLDFEGFGVAYLIASPSYQRIVGPGTLCLAQYGGAKVAVIIRGTGEASASFNGDSQGCSPGQ